MYNRYVRDDAGVYQRVPSGEPERPAGGGGRPRGGSGGILSQLLGRLKLEEVDTGDLLLLAIFLPVAASAGGLAGPDSFDWGAVPAWGVLAAPVAVGAACHWIYNRFLRKTTQRSLNQ